MSKEKIKVLYISGSWPSIKCGVGDYLYHLTKAMNVDWYVITSKQAQKSHNVFNIVQSWTIKDWKKIKDKIKDINPDVIHFEYPSVIYGRKIFPNLLPRLIRNSFSKTPLFVTVHEYHDASILGKRRTRLTLGGVKNVIVTNSEDRTELSRIFKSKIFSEIRVGSNIGNSKMSHSAVTSLKKQYNPKDMKVITYFGFIDPSKGVQNLIEAVEKLPEDVSLIIATSFDPKNTYHQKLKRIIESSEKDIHWTGYLKEAEISGIFSLSDLVVLPFDQPASLRRGSLIAAIMHGCAIITTGPCEELLEDGKNCSLLINNSPENIAQTVGPLLRHPAELAILRKGAITLQSKFDWNEIAKKHVEQYQRTI